MSDSLWRWGGVLILSGGIVFWIGAFLPPYKQWMTSDVREYLSIIAANRINWYVIHGCFLLGIILSLLGIQILSQALMSSPEAGTLFPNLGMTLYVFATTFWILNIAFRLTVTMWAAERLAGTNELYDSFKTWMDWSNVIFALYMILAYAGIGFIGLSLRTVSWMPGWVSLFAVIFGFVGTVAYVIRFPLFAPPLMVHLPLMVVGLFVLLRMKTG